MVCGHQKLEKHSFMVSYDERVFYPVPLGSTDLQLASKVSDRNQKERLFLSLGMSHGNGYYYYTVLSIFLNKKTVIWVSKMSRVIQIVHTRSRPNSGFLTPNSDSALHHSFSELEPLGCIWYSTMLSLFKPST